MNNPYPSLMGLLFLLPCVFPGHAAAAGKFRAGRLPIIIFAGQSNMVGQARIEGLTAEEAKGRPGVYYYFPGGRWDTYTPNYYLANNTGLGPEVSAGKALYPALGRFGMVKYAANGTSLSSDWDPAREGSLYHGMLAHINEALRSLRVEGAEGDVAAFFWMQGEGDSQTPEQAAAYEKNLAALIRRLRDDLKDRSLPVVIAQISSCEAWTYGEQIREAQKKTAAAEKNVAVFSTTDLSRWATDQAHYDTRGIVELGNRFAAALLRLLPEKRPFKKAKK